jgi:hypothetical protein
VRAHPAQIAAHGNDRAPASEREHGIRRCHWFSKLYRTREISANPGDSGDRQITEPDRRKQ